MTAATQLAPPPALGDAARARIVAAAKCLVRLLDHPYPRGAGGVRHVYFDAGPPVAIASRADYERQVARAKRALQQAVHAAGRANVVRGGGP